MANQTPGVAMSKIVENLRMCAETIERLRIDDKAITCVSVMNYRRPDIQINWDSFPSLAKALGVEWSIGEPYENGSVPCDFVSEGIQWIAIAPAHAVVESAAP